MNRSQYENDMYEIISPICEEIERKGSYTGNGHHLAQRIAHTLALSKYPLLDRNCSCGRVMYHHLTRENKNGRSVYLVCKCGKRKKGFA